MLAAFTRVPELSIEEEEAKRLASAFSLLAEQYDFGVDPRVFAVVNMASVAASVYGPRAMAIAIRVKREAAERARKQQTTGA